MLEIHSMVGGDRKLRPQTQNQNQPQPLKCPRCHSLNTKFCYYNNYNLSQPRHFCKNCRRYWTKGGVLRNVPVGGGSRKSKRSTTPKTTNTNDNPSSSSDTAPATAPTTPPPAPPSQPTEPELNSNSHSSSESSSLTVAATEAMSAPTSNSVSNHDVLESKLVSLEQGHHSGIFSEIETFTSLIASNNEPLGFGFGTNSNNNSTNNNILDATSFRFGVTRGQVQSGEKGQWQQQSNQDFGTASFFDHTVPVEFSHSLLQHNNVGHSGGFGSLDWQQPADQGLFDLPDTVDQSYWSPTHWSDQDNQTIFHLP